MAPAEWLPMPGDDAPPSERKSPEWLMAYSTPELDAHSEAYAFVSSRLRATVPHARVVSVQRVQHRMLWTRFERFRNEDLEPFNGNDANEQYLFHGTGARAASDVLAGRDGLDPRFSDGGGFYGAGTYLAESAAYPIGGRYAHRVSGHSGARMHAAARRAHRGRASAGARHGGERRDARDAHAGRAARRPAIRLGARGAASAVPLGAGRRRQRRRRVRRFCRVPLGADVSESD